MSDNTTLDAGSGGDTIAADDIGGVKFQRVKLIQGADGANDGDVASGNPLPVKATGAVAHDGVAAGNPLFIGAFAKATAPSDVSADADVVHLWALLNGALCVNIASGTAAATQSGTWNVTNISGTISLPTGAATAAKQPALGTAGTASSDVITVQGVASMTPLLATLSGTNNIATVSTVSTITNVVHVDDNSGSLTIDAPVGTPAFVRLSDGSSAISTLPVSLASVPSHAVTNAGTFAVQATCTNAGTFAVQAVDAGDTAHDAADGGNPVKIGAKAIASPKGLTMVSANDRANMISDLDGIQIVKLATSGADFISERVSNTDGSSTAFSNFGAVASTFNVITAYSVFRTDAGTTMAYLDFRDGTSGAVLWSVPLPPGGGANLSLGGVPIFKGSANTALAYDVSTALSTVYISVSGYQTKA